MPIFIVQVLQSSRQTGRLKRALRAAVLAALVSWLVPAAIAANAQAPSGNGSDPPKDVIALFDTLNDIDKMRLINPLKLTPDQVDKLITVVTAAQAEYTKRIADSVGPPLRKLSDEINATKKQVLTGGSIPPEFDAKIWAADIAYQKSREQINYENFKGLIDKTRAILTEKQIQLAGSIMKERSVKKTETDASKWYNAWLLFIFIDYPRIVPLLKEIHEAQTAAAGAK